MGLLLVARTFELEVSCSDWTFSTSVFTAEYLKQSLRRRRKWKVRDSDGTVILTIGEKLIKGSLLLNVAGSQAYEEPGDGQFVAEVVQATLGYGGGLAIIHLRLAGPLEK